MKISSVLLSLFLLGGSLIAKVQRDTLYLNRGSEWESGTAIPVLYFNHTAQFDTTLAHVNLYLGDSLLLTLVNTDQISHRLVLESSGEIVLTAGKSRTIQFTAKEMRCFRLYGQSDYSRLMGLNTFILVRPQAGKQFVWQLHGTDSDLNRNIGIRYRFSAQDFRPDYFSINNLRSPATMQDTLSTVRGHVGDTLYIHIINAGFMEHSIHFHGYHVIIEASNRANHQIGWDKDSFPVKPGEWIRVRMVPHQPGRYPVHDHNLIAVTSGGNYPGGMIAHLHITP